MYGKKHKKIVFRPGAGNGFGIAFGTLFIRHGLMSQSYAMPEIQKSGYSEFRNSGNLEVRKSGYPDFRICRCLDMLSKLC